VLATLAALLAGLVTAIGILALLTWCMLATLLAALPLVILAAVLTAALVLATLVLLALILIHRSLLWISPSPQCQPANTRSVPEVPRMLNLHARSPSEPQNQPIGLTAAGTPA
jgi:hypothetical protein